MTEHSGADLVQLAVAGDHEAFGLLATRYQMMALRVCMNVVANDEVARELAQDTMLQAFLSLDSLRDPSRFRSWLQGIARNVSRNYIRTQKSTVTLDAAGGLRVSDEQALHEVVYQRETRALIRAQINRLSPSNRAAILLYYYGQLSVTEIAEVLGISPTAVKSRLFKSRKLLKTQLAPLLATERTFEQEAERQTTMVKITAVHAIRAALTTNYVLMLLHQPKRRALPIWIGAQEGEQILIQLRKFPTSRPTTFQFMATLLATSDVNVQEVRINGLKNDLFYATVITEQHGAMHRVDSRPSDAVALALYAGSPIFVTEELMATTGRDLPDTFDEQAWKNAPLTDTELETLYGVNKPQPPDLENKLERFTRRATRAWKQAQAEAIHYDHHYIGTEHLLLGLVSDENSMAAQVLSSMNTTVVRVTDAFKRRIQRGLQPPPETPVAVPRLKQVVQLADEERRELGHQYIGTEHLLLGLAREGNGAAAIILHDLGVNLNQVRSRIIDHVTST